MPLHEKVNRKSKIVNGEKSIYDSPSTIHQRRKRAGFTLVEILLALFLFTAMITILLSASGTLLHTRKSNLETLAAKIATKQIENLRNTDFDLLPPGSDTFSDTELPQLPQGVANRAITNATIDSQVEPDVKNVSITITWTENGIPKQFKTETLIYKYGL